MRDRDRPLPYRVTVFREQDRYVAETVVATDGEFSLIRIPGSYHTADDATAGAIRHMGNVYFLQSFVRFFFLYGIFMASLVGSVDLISRALGKHPAIFGWAWFVVPAIILLGLFAARMFAYEEREKKVTMIVVRMEHNS